MICEHDRAGFCRQCHCRALGFKGKKYNWSPMVIERLQEAYREGRPRLLHERLNRLSSASGIPNSSLVYKAGELGIRFVKPATWTAVDRRCLEMLAGNFKPAEIAKRMKRSTHAIHVQMHRQGLNGRYRNANSIEEVAMCFGTSTKTVRRWIAEGMLKYYDGGVTEQSLRGFIHTQPSEYDLRRVDQVWFKDLVFGTRSFGVADAKLAHGNATNQGQPTEVHA